MSRNAFLLVVLLLAATGARAQDAPPDAAQPSGGESVETARVLRLSIADVGRLALRNSPAFKVLLLDPSIARTFEDEARAEFDPLLAASASGGTRQSEVFFNPSAFGPGGGGGSGLLQEDTLGGSATLSSVEEWGGAWQLGYTVESTDRSGASSISALSPRYDGLLSLGYTHPLLRHSGRDVRLSTTRQAERLTEDSELRLARSAEETVAAAESLYWDLVGAAADLDVRRKSREVAQELLDVARARLEARRGLPVEVSEAEAGVARRDVDVIASETLVQNLADRLRELIMPFDAESPDLDLELAPTDAAAATPGDLPAKPTRSDFEQIFGQRGDVRAVDARLAAARLAELRTRNAALYELNAFADGGLIGLGSGFSGSSTRVGDRDTYVWEAGLELAIPIGNRAQEARLSRAERTTQRAQRERAAIRNTAMREVREAARNVRSAAERIAAARRARVAAEEQLSAEKSRLENGRSTPFEVLQVEEDLSEFEAQEIAASVDYEKARVDLELASGTLLASRELEGLALGE